MGCEGGEQPVPPTGTPDIGPQPLYRSGLHEILTMAFPVIVAMASSTVMQFADFWMVSRVGTDEAAAVSPAGILVFTIISFFAGVLTCTNTFVSQSHANGEFEECSRYVWQGLYVALFAGAVALVLWPVAPHIFRALRHGARIEELETAYFRMRLFSVGTGASIVVMTGFMQGISRPRLTMYAAVAGCAINVGFNWVLIFGKLGFPALGILGAGLATSAATALQVAMLIGIFLSPKYARKYGSRRARRFAWSRMRNLIRIGWPSGVSWSLDVGIWGIFIAVIVGRLGKHALAASNMAGQIIHLSFMPTIGLSIATTALVGQNIGRRDLLTARARASTSMKLAMTYMFFMGAMFFLFREQLISFFLKKPETAEAAADNLKILQLGTQILVFAAVFQVFDAMAIINNGALKGAGDTRFPMLATLSLGTVLFLPLCWVLTHKLKLGVVGAWGSAAAFICILGLTLLWRWRSGAWEKIDIFRRKPFEPAELTEHVTPYEPGEEIAGP